MILARRIRRNKPNQILTEDGWIEEPDTTAFGAEPSEDVELDTTAIGDPLVCDCGFEAKTAGGLSTHQRTHEEEE